jgi:hypothetical protein
VSHRTSAFPLGISFPMHTSEVISEFVWINCNAEVENLSFPNEKAINKNNYTIESAFEHVDWSNVVRKFDCSVQHPIDLNFYFVVVLFFICALESFTTKLCTVNLIISLKCLKLFQVCSLCSQMECKFFIISFAKTSNTVTKFVNFSCRLSFCLMGLFSSIYSCL